MADSTPYSVPKEPGSWRAIALAVAVHAALFAFLWIGIRWQSETPVAIEAEVWDMQAKDAAPKQPLPPQEEPVPEPKPRPEPEPVSKPEPKPEVKTPEKQPDITLEQEKKKKEKAKREEEERLARLKEEKERIEKEKQAQLEKEKKDRLEKEKQELAKKEKEKQLALEKEKAEIAKKEKAEAERKRQEALDAKLLAAMRKDAQKNLAGPAGSGGTGTAAKSQGMRGDPSYAAKVAAKIKSNTAFVVPGDLQGNPAVEYDVQLFPDGSLRGAPRKVKSSGIPAFDEAVKRAIELSAPFPPDKSGTVPSGFPVIHRPKEQ
ncbi:cell division and transport-associated protein TolA [Paucimonas lemoignei]|uniref:Cell division and transport-associated protein TolA n=1 Tax=Paucimonas lemoignei TaxID=29443 RepID=A0A4R3I1V1_PAULE|nr:cell envelope integrity protein TolA [Paucimonas lemoignei]TCS38701.1 cell division and transport-associated protein TolA [Paucimonas lemoignei]